MNAKILEIHKILQNYVHPDKIMIFLGELRKGNLHQDYDKHTIFIDYIHNQFIYM